MFKVNGKVLLPGSSFILGDIKYPPNWLDLSSMEDRDRLGISKYSPPLSNEGPVPHMSDVKEVSLEEEKLFVCLRKTRKWVRILSATDWAVVRAAEIGTPVPEAVALERAQARSEMQQIQLLIESATDREELRTIFLEEK